MCLPIKIYGFASATYKYYIESREWLGFYNQFTQLYFGIKKNIQEQRVFLQNSISNIEHY